jgi:hypothetical protein
MPTTTTFLFCAVVAIMLIYAGNYLNIATLGGLSGFGGGLGPAFQTGGPAKHHTGKGTIQRWACCTFDNRTP